MSDPPASTGAADDAQVRHHAGMDQSGQAWSLLKVEAVGIDDGFPGWLRTSLVDASGTSWTFADRATNLVGGDEPVPRSFPAPAHLRCRVRRTERDAQGRNILTARPFRGTSPVADIHVNG
ncbi:hypothetical protein [Catellatospora sichuanensis]|uniref:hypothetical protein n=1 Tax=Catellatospora sichuanensis TaxID=1969805 RepID=UPI001182E1F8|nr:hypothetical protein [Catellatospora sichuanensis]